MPAVVQFRGGKYRVVEEDGTLVKNRAGTAVDGGGHGTKAAAQRQANAINASKEKQWELEMTVQFQVMVGKMKYVLSANSQMMFMT